MDVAVTGPIGYRRFVLEKKCVANEGHKHNYDHATIVIRGRVQVTVTDDDGKELAKREYGAGDLFEVKASHFHEIKALEDNSVYLCVFSHRDFDGLVTQRYVGNAEAYI